MEPKQWEMWYVNAIFEDDKTKSKPRPAIIIVTGTGFVIGLKVTTKGPRENDYELEFWSEAGLSQKSYVRLDKTIKISSCDILHKLGVVHPVDRLKLEYRMAALL